MYIDRNAIKQYPFVGSFYRTCIDESKPLDEQVEEEILVLETECDIQQMQTTDSGGLIQSTVKIFFPFDKEVGIDIVGGDTFRANMFGSDIGGTINVPYPNQLGVCEVTLKDLNV